MALLASRASPAQPYSAVNTILVVVGTLLVVAGTLFLSVKLSDWRSKRRPGNRVDHPQGRSGE
jgi:hypothetical protein